MAGCWCPLLTKYTTSVRSEGPTANIVAQKNNSTLWKVTHIVSSVTDAGFGNKVTDKYTQYIVH